MKSCKLEIWKKRWFFLASKCSKKLKILGGNNLEAWNVEQNCSRSVSRQLIRRLNTFFTSVVISRWLRSASRIQGDRLLAKVHFQRQRQIKELTNFSNRVFQCGIVQRKFCHITHEITIYNQILNMSEFYRQWHTIWCKNCEFGRKLKAKIWHL